MRKFFPLTLFLLVLFSFSVAVQAVGQHSGVDVKDEVKRNRNTVALKLDGAAEAAKRDRYLKARRMKENHHNMHLSMLSETTADSASAVDMVMDKTSTHWQADSSGDLVWTGACYNNGSSPAVFVKVTITVYDAYNNYLGSDFTYVWGGNNSKLSSSGLYTNALGNGDWGFFRIWTSGISYSDASTIYYDFSYKTYAHTAAYANLAFDGSVYFTDYLGSLKFYGNIKNPSSNYVTYFTKVAFAAFDSTNTYVLDVDSAYVDGSDYKGSSSAIQPGQSAPFDNWFFFADYSSSSSSFLSSFEWNEDATSTMTEKDPPFGTFDTPINGSTIRSSVPVTGWVLDDGGVDNVKIYRESGGSLLYVGEALLVEGARPDVAAAYPGYPNNTQAGWGYMMLSHFLPNGGNGTYTLHAIATDKSGKSTTLGTKTITCDNANAVKPFGAIDTPGQGGTASGSSFINWGWALTPQPNSIPTDGSTINVYVDGVNIGHPTYNKYRSDLAALFPGYANSDGAAGLFYLDTTAYSEGVHTIQWTARDSGDNTAGIGSRYFSITNTNRSGSSGTTTLNDVLDKAQHQNRQLLPQEIMSLPPTNSGDMVFHRGFNTDSLPRPVITGEKGEALIRIHETERIRLELSERHPTAQNYTYSGYLRMGKRLTSLPIGSTLKSHDGVFFWQPGPGQLGCYNLVFVGTGMNGEAFKKNVVVEILPAQQINES